MSVSVSQQEIARYCGVSQRTVSRCFTTPDAVRKKTLVKVLAASARLGYRPNRYARCVRSGSFGAIDLILSTNEYRSNLPNAMMDGILDALTGHDWHLVVSRLPDEVLTDENFIPNALREAATDGMLINYTDHIPATMLSTIRKHKMPSVWINALLDVDCIHPDDEGAAYAATCRLIERGHRRIAYLQASDWDAHYSTSARTEGFCRAMNEASLEPVVFGNLDERHLSNAELVLHRQKMHENLAVKFRDYQITAVVAYSAQELLHAYWGAGELGLRVPGDFMGAFFVDEANSSQIAVPALYIILPHRQIGRQAVSMLTQKINDPDLLLAPVSVPFDLKKM